MADEKTKYLQLLRIEMEDLRHDILHLEDKCRKDADLKQITEYVCRENVALFENELLGLRVFEFILDATNPEPFPSLQALMDHLRTRFRTRVKDHDLAEAICVFVDRKMAKVERYLKAL